VKSAIRNPRSAIRNQARLPKPMLDRVLSWTDETGLVRREEEVW